MSRDPKKESRATSGVMGAALAQSEARFAAITENARDAIFRKDLERRYTYVNPAMEQLLGLPAADLIGRTPEEVFPPEAAEVIREVDDVSLAGEVADAIRTLEIRGHELTFHTIQTPIRDDTGAVLEISGIVRDITAQRQAERALRESEVRYRALVEALPVGVVIHQDGKVVFANPAVMKLYGAERPEEIIGRPVTDFVPEDHRAEFERRLAEAYQPGRVVPPTEGVQLRADGTPVAVEAMSRSLIWEGQPASQVVVWDISERQRAAERAKMHRDDLSWLAEHTLELMDLPLHRDLHQHVAETLHQRLGNVVVAVTEYEEAKRLLRARSIVGAGKLLERATQMIGVKTPSAMAGHADDALLKRLRQGTLQRTGEGIFGVSGGVVPRALCRPIERLFDVRESWVMGFLREGVMFGSVAIVLRGDATIGDPKVIETFVGNVALALDRRRAEATLRENEERFRQLAEVSDEIFFSVDADGNFSYLSPAVERILGFAPEDMIGQPFGSFTAADDLSRVAPLVAQTLAGKPNQGITFRVPTKDGRTVELEGSGYPVHRDDGRVIMHGTARDVTERRRLEEQVLQMQKMEAIGNLAGGVAHDFNNLLTAILGYAEDLKRLSTPGDEVHEAASVIENAGIRAAEFTRQLLGFARRGKIQAVLVDVHEIVQEVIGVLSRTVDRRITLSQRLQAQESHVLGDPGQIQQVVLNLGVNAAEAMPEGGTLTFETAVVREPACTLRPMADGAAPSARCLELRVSDTGVGIPEEVQPRIFEPFFTTKPEGRGTGMGLATVYGVVENHGGVVTVSSAPGQGTSFVVRLPLEPPKTGEHRVRSAEKPISGEGRVLVVEDEPVVRGLAERMLRRLGYTVITAADGAEAVRLYEQQGSDIDLVLLDLVMPEMNGRECFARLRALDPDVKVILTSGYGEEEVIADVLASGVSGFLQKPFALNRLSRVVDEVLNPRQSD